MKKSSIVAIVLVAVVALAAAFVWAQQDSEEEPATESQTTNQEESTEPEAAEPENTETEASEEQTITYDGSGFSPSTLTVSQGDTVTFRNESSTPVWPASDDHPVHTDLSGFDALEGLEQGEEYSYTFDETGEWGFHNHLSSGQTGTIIVE